MDTVGIMDVDTTAMNITSKVAAATRIATPEPVAAAGSVNSLTIALISINNTMAECENKTRVDFNTTLITVDNKTGERHYGHIEAKLPTPEELIRRPYGGSSRRREDTENG